MDTWVPLCFYFFFIVMTHKHHVTCHVGQTLVRNAMQESYQPKQSTTLFRDYICISFRSWGCNISGFVVEVLKFINLYMRDVKWTYSLPCSCCLGYTRVLSLGHKIKSTNYSCPFKLFLCSNPPNQGPQSTQPVHFNFLCLQSTVVFIYQHLAFAKKHYGIPRDLMLQSYGYSLLGLGFSSLPKPVFCLG